LGRFLNDFFPEVTVEQFPYNMYIPIIESMNRGDWLPGLINFKNNPYFDAMIKINVRTKSV